MVYSDVALAMIVIPSADGSYTDLGIVPERHQIPILSASRESIRVGSQVIEIELVATSDNVTTRSLSGGNVSGVIPQCVALESVVPDAVKVVESPMECNENLDGFNSHWIVSLERKVKFGFKRKTKKYDRGVEMFNVSIISSQHP